LISQQNPHVSHVFSRIYLKKIIWLWSL